MYWYYTIVTQIFVSQQSSATLSWEARHVLHQARTRIAKGTDLDITDGAFDGNETKSKEADGLECRRGQNPLKNNICKYVD